jgi:hypothetical protein
VQITLAPAEPAPDLDHTALNFGFHTGTAAIHVELGQLDAGSKPGKGASSRFANIIMRDIHFGSLDLRLEHYSCCFSPPEEL